MTRTMSPASTFRYTVRAYRDEDLAPNLASYRRAIDGFMLGQPHKFTMDQVARFAVYAGVIRAEMRRREG